jgi:hypothetical protein
MLWLGGLLALDVTTSTPDALCPPLAEVRAAVQARVGEVKGDYHAEFSLLRGERGRQALQLVLRDGSEPVLEREIELEGAECQDAAQAIALVLERYFDAVERPATPDPAPVPRPTEPVPAPRNDSSAPTEAAPGPSARIESDWRAHAGIAQDLELGVAPLLGVALFPSQWRATTNVRFGAAFDLAFFVTPITETVRTESIRAFTLQPALSVPLELHSGPWSSGVGGWAQVRLQRARAQSLTNAQTGYRAILGLGGMARVGWSPAPRWLLSATVAGGGQLVSASSRLVLQKADGSQNTVLVPEPWFAQAQLTLGMTL